MLFARKEKREKKVRGSLTQKESLLLRRGDADYDGWYDEGLKICGMTDNRHRKPRFYNLMQFFRQTLPLEGDMAECGAWHGLSSFLLCRCAARHDPGFRGEGYHIFDSFQGLPPPGTEDRIADEKIPMITGKFDAPLEEVKRTLSDFPKIQYYAGWIPGTFADLPDRIYRFVHVDLDLYQSTRAAIEYFYPRLHPKGILVCDDYASPGWPGAKQAVDEYAGNRGIRILSLSTGQAVFLNANRC